MGGSIIKVMMDSLFDGRIHYHSHDGRSLMGGSIITDGLADWMIPYHGREGQPLIGGSIITVEKDSL